MTNKCDVNGMTCLLITTLTFVQTILVFYLIILIFYWAEGGHRIFLKIWFITIPEKKSHLGQKAANYRKSTPVEIYIGLFQKKNVRILVFLKLTPWNFPLIFSTGGLQLFFWKSPFQRLQMSLMLIFYFHDKIRN